ncbi:type I restriction-modification system subunit M [Rhodopirellula sp. MGV]|uniref:type I restriction-modification system subunit M n=1 Tax=Rhodopirellula sp. MGV TaxID=2023130 RepID=UPI00117B2016|nr:type I restriction-modification system subunit M [Rhodopirellula sp. MGV]
MSDTGYRDVRGFCKGSTLEDVKAINYVLTPVRYDGTALLENDGIPLEPQLADLTTKLYQQMDEAEKLARVILNKLETLGYGA